MYMYICMYIFKMINICTYTNNQHMESINVINTFVCIKKKKYKKTLSIYYVAVDNSTPMCFETMIRILPQYIN